MKSWSSAFLLYATIFICQASSALVIPKDAKLVASTMARLQDDKIITLRDVKVSKVIERAIQKNQKIKTPAVSTEDVQFDDVSKTILEKVAVLEAETFKYSSYDEALMQDLKKSLSASNELEALGIRTDKEIEQRLKEKLIARSFIALRSENLKTVVSETELRSYYEKNRTQFADMSFEKFQNTIREYYLKEKLTEKLNEWFSILKTKYQVRIYETNSAPKSRAQ
jgi:hypothetical protein